MNRAHYKYKNYLLNCDIIGKQCHLQHMKYLSQNGSAHYIFVFLSMNVRSDHSGGAEQIGL